MLSSIILPSQTPDQVATGHVYLEWLVEEGDEVEEGQRLATISYGYDS